MYNPTCLITGKRDNLKMHALRNDKGEMTGWIFLHESVEVQNFEGDIKWNYTVNISDNLESKKGGEG